MGQTEGKEKEVTAPSSVKEEESSANTNNNTIKSTGPIPSILNSITVNDSEEIINEYQKYAKTKIKETEDTEKITTVTQSKTVATEPELETLEKLPRFTPLIKTTVEKNPKVYPGKELPKEHNLDTFDVKGLLAIGKEYQSFCKNWATDVMTQQKLVSAKIKKVEATCSKTLNQVSSHTNDVKKYSAQFREVDRLQAHLDQINNSLINAIETTDKLYAILSHVPEFMENSEDGPLEPFSVYLKKRNQDSENKPDSTIATPIIEKPRANSQSDVRVTDLRNSGISGF